MRISLYWGFRTQGFLIRFLHYMASDASLQDPDKTAVNALALQRGQGHSEYPKRMYKYIYIYKHIPLYVYMYVYGYIYTHMCIIYILYTHTFTCVTSVYVHVHTDSIAQTYICTNGNSDVNSNVHMSVIW